MKDFISKVTFGFLMAQLVPGLVVVYAFSFAYVSFFGTEAATIEKVVKSAINVWNVSVESLLVFLILSLGAGMAIHGLHWAVLGFMEYYYAERKDGKIINLKSVSDTFWHNWRIIFQIVMGPIKLVWEIILFLFSKQKLNEVAIEENIPDIPLEKMEAFKFLQDFYLHFAQFYAHTAYALVVLFVLVFAGILWSPGLVFSTRCVLFAVAIWLTSGCFFLISRVQLASLFKGEYQLRNHKKASRPTRRKSRRAPQAKC